MAALRRVNTLRSQFNSAGLRLRPRAAHVYRARSRFLGRESSRLLTTDCAGHVGRAERKERRMAVINSSSDRDNRV